MIKTLLPFMLARLKEPSTLRGISMLATACGLAISPEQAESIIVGGLTLVGLLGLLPDAKQ